MAKKRISHGKEISDCEFRFEVIDDWLLLLFVDLYIKIVEVEDVKAALSEKLFATDRCPCERVHMYLTIGNLLWVRNKLDGTPEMKLMGSWFGSLFKISLIRSVHQNWACAKNLQVYLCTLFGDVHVRMALTDFLSEYIWIPL
ncbi:hypothetical protein F2Q70_00021211 [Brassica cretica]|uniref:Uncharacterized protein n=1 Tax=Brassica cretica TaxID=69181 RepID=A0A8S9GXN1_BRACR|nr:hypothetical protein F2Q70_00021211 [Brassica cretica]